MTSLTVQIPDDLAKDLQDQAQIAGKTAEEYAAALLSDRRSEQQAKIERFHELIREGDESGDAVPMDDAYFARKKQDLRERFPEKAEKVQEVGRDGSRRLRA